MPLSQVSRIVDAIWVIFDVIQVNWAWSMPSERKSEPSLMPSEPYLIPSQVNCIVHAIWVSGAVSDFIQVNRASPMPSKTRSEPSLMPSEPYLMPSESSEPMLSSQLSLLLVSCRGCHPWKYQTIRARKGERCKSHATKSANNNQQCRLRTVPCSWKE
jgi:hypothetical protein